MGKSAKPRKPYHQKRILIPLVKESRDNLAMQLHMNVETAILAPDRRVLSSLSRKLAIMTVSIDWQQKTPICERQDEPAKALIEFERTLTSIEDRFERVGKWGVTGDEARTLRRVAGVLDVALKRIPMNIFEAAKVRVDELTAMAV